MVLKNDLPELSIENYSLVITYNFIMGNHNLKCITVIIGILIGSYLWVILLYHKNIIYNTNYGRL